MEMQPSVFATLIDIFLEPKKALGDIRGHTGWLWYPLLITIGSSVLVFAWYYGTADWDVIQQQTMDFLASRHYGHEQLEQIRNGLSRTRMVLQTCIGISIVSILIYLTQALYLFFVSKIAGYQVQGFGDWFSFTSWTYFPSAIGNIAFAITYAIAGKQATLPSLDVSSINTLLFHLPIDSAWYGLVSSLRLSLFWSLGLMTIGFMQWTGRNLSKSIVIVLAPYVLIYGIWALLKII